MAPGGWLAVCVSCKALRASRGAWTGLESHLRDHLGLVVSHGLCPHCAGGESPSVLAPGSVAVCASCKSVLGPGRAPVRIEAWLRERLRVRIIRGLCPSCMPEPSRRPN